MFSLMDRTEWNLLRQKIEKENVLVYFRLDGRNFTAGRHISLCFQCYFKFLLEKYWNPILVVFAKIL